MVPTGSRVSGVANTAAITREPAWCCLVRWSGAPRRSRRVRAGQPACRPGRGDGGGRGGGAPPWWGSRRPRSWSHREPTPSPPSTPWPRASGSAGARSSSVTPRSGCVARGASLEPPIVPDLVFARFDALAVVDPRGVDPRAGRRRRRGGCSTTRSPRRVGRRVTASARSIAPTQWTSGLDRDEYADRVSTVLDLLRAGECYQVNLTRRLTCDDAIDPIGLYDALAHAHPAPHLALLHLPELGRGTAVVSASPERYLRLRAPRGRDPPDQGHRGRRARRCAPAARTTPRT